jgi:hypothetical protein
MRLDIKSLKINEKLKKKTREGFIQVKQTTSPETKSTYISEISE